MVLATRDIDSRDVGVDVCSRVFLQIVVFFLYLSLWSAICEQNCPSGTLKLYSTLL